MWRRIAMMGSSRSGPQRSARRWRPSGGGQPGQRLRHSSSDRFFSHRLAVRMRWGQAREGLAQAAANSNGQDPVEAPVQGAFSLCRVFLRQRIAGGEPEPSRDVPLEDLPQVGRDGLRCGRLVFRQGRRTTAVNGSSSLCGTSPSSLRAAQRLATRDGASSGKEPTLLASAVVMMRVSGLVVGGVVMAAVRSL